MAKMNLKGNENKIGVLRTKVWSVTVGKDALKKMYLQVASMLAQDKCLRHVFSSCLRLILE